MFPNHIKKGGAKLKPGPMWHEHLLARQIQPVADRLGLPHITWRLLRHWGDIPGERRHTHEGRPGASGALP